MTRRTNSLAIPPLKLNSPDVSFQEEAGGETMVGVVLVPCTSQRLPGVPSSTNDNQFLLNPPVQLSISQGDISQCQGSKTMDCQETVNCRVVAPAVIVTGQSQKKDVRPFQSNVQIKSVKGVLCVSHCLSAPVVRNALHIVRDPPVGGRLQKFWQVWFSLGSNPRVVSILKEGYSLPFKVRPPLSRSPVIVSHYADPVKSKNLKESLQALIQKQAVEKVLVPSSLAFYNRLFLVPKPNNRWRPILDLGQLNLYLASASFKMETPETIRLSLQQGEWVTSAGFSYPDQSKITEVLKVPSQQSSLPIHLPFFRPVDGSVGVHQGRQGSQAYGTISGYPNPPVPRRLVSESPLPGNVPMTYPDPFGPMSQPGLGSQHVKVGTVSPTGVQLCRLPFRPLSRPVQTHAGEVDIPDSESQLPLGTRDLLSQAVHVPNWSSDSHGKTGGVGTPSHETYPMAFKEVLARPGNSREDDSPSKVSPCSPKVVVGPRQSSEGSTLTPITARPPAVYRCLKRRPGRTLETSPPEASGPSQKETCT